MKHKGSSQICMHNVHRSIYIEVTLANDLIKEALKSSKVLKCTYPIILGRHTKSL